MVRLSAYDTLVSLTQNQNVFSSYTQNTVKREHKFTGVINDQYFDLCEVGTRQQALDKFAKTVAQRFGVDGDLTNSTNSQKLGWQLQCWSPARELFRLGEGLFIHFDKEDEDGSTTVVAKKQEKRGEKGAEKKEPEVVATHSAESFADAEHNLAIQLLSNSDYTEKYVEKKQRQAQAAGEPDFDTMTDFGWSLYENCDEDEEEGEYCKTLKTFCESNTLAAPEWKKEMPPKEPKEDYKRGVLCMLKINSIKSSKEEAAKEVMAKVSEIIASQNASAQYYEQQAEASKQEQVKQETAVSEIKSPDQIFDEDSVKALPSDDVVQFPILALNDYVRADSTLGKPVFSDESTEVVDGKNMYILKCTVDSVVTKAKASSKKQAKQLAAQVMLITLKNCGDLPSVAAPAKKATPKPQPAAPAVEKPKGIAQAAPGTPDTNPVSGVTMAAQFLKVTPVWNVDDGAGQPPNKIFTATVSVNDMTATAQANAKKEAKNAAAAQLLQTIEQRHGDWRSQMQANKAQKRQFSGRGGRGGKFQRNR